LAPRLMAGERGGGVAAFDGGPRQW
jgi:hypothetical protein